MTNIRKIGRPKKPHLEISLLKIDLSTFNPIISSYITDLKYKLEEEDCTELTKLYIETFFKQEQFIQNLLILLAEFKDYKTLATNIGCPELKDEILIILRLTKNTLKKQCKLQH